MPPFGRTLGFLCGLALLSLGNSLYAQDDIELDDVVVDVTAPWPEFLSKGYQPLRVVVNNVGTADRELDFTIEGNSWISPDSEVERSVRVGPGEELTLDFILPVFQMDHGSYRMEIDTGEEEQRLFPAEVRRPNRLVHPIVFLAERQPPETEVVDLVDALKTITHTEGSNTYSDVSIAAVTFDMAPSQYEAYTSLDAVIVDTSRARPGPRVTEPLLAWAQLGGTVVYAGPGAASAAQEAPGVAPWLEERFLVFEEMGHAAYRFGMGLFVVAESSDFVESEAATAVVKRALEQQWSAVPNDYPAGRADPRPMIPALKPMPYRALALLLVLFAILLGPVNFTVVKNAKKPALLLVTIPVLALLGSGAVLLYGVLYQGIDVKSGSHTLTLLDQRAHRSMTVEVRSIFAGLSPGGGLRPEPHTACFPAIAHRFDGNTPGYKIDLDGGTVLSGDFMPVRRRVTQTLLSERAARGRLEFERRGGTLHVTNALGTSVEQLVVRDPAGDYHFLIDELAPGSSRPLQSATRGEVRTMGVQWRDLLAERSDEDDERESRRHRGRVRAAIAYAQAMAAGSTAEEPAALPEPSDAALPVGTGAPLVEELPDLWPASYAAMLAENPFSDDCGVETNESLGLHVVLGILDPEDAAW